MYRLTIFLMISCVVNRQLIGAVRGGESLSGRNNIYFDAYDHGHSGEEEESGDDFRDAVLMHPEEVIDIPPIPDERDYEMDFRNDSSLDDFTDVRSEITRNFLQDIVDHIQSAFGKLPYVSPVQPVYEPILYYLESSLEESYKTIIKQIIGLIEEKSCIPFSEDRTAPLFVIGGTDSCITTVVDNIITVSQSCFDPTQVIDLIFKLSDLCHLLIPEPYPKSSGIYLSSFRNKIRQEIEEEEECVDKLKNCNRWARNGGCSSFFQIMSALCPRTCHLCGDSCMDYSSNCETNDTVRDCILNYDKKRYTCAGTCGICKNSFPDRCVDKVHECEWLAKKGYCPKYPDVMKEYCPVSCGYCKPESCTDERDDCSGLERIGACKKIPGLMQKSCSKTCNFCENGMGSGDYKRERPTAKDCTVNMNFVRHYCPKITILPPY